jgi:hypothetical protein
MSDGKTGSVVIFTDPWEIRRVIVAEGVQYHDVYIPFLSRKLPEFKPSTDRLSGEYSNKKQMVRYEITIARSKDDFKKGLETDRAIVIYDGHSRHGRGACFDPANRDTGDHWENGATIHEGIFRFGYPIVPVEIHDINEHQYHFPPCPAENAKPANENKDPFTRHPSARVFISPKSIPAHLKGFVQPAFLSSIDKYWGFNSSEDGLTLLLNAGWNATASAPYDLGSVNLRCRTFCHFGCSSKLHYWTILRDYHYKNWPRPKPPTDRFAYFTTAPSDSNTVYWLYHLLRCPLPNDKPSHWYDTHQWALGATNATLKELTATFRIF